jgi:hypothetical protein
MLREDYGGTSPDSRRGYPPDGRELIVPMGDAGIDRLGNGRKDVLFPINYRYSIA